MNDNEDTVSVDFSKMKISELLRFAEEQPEKERQTSSLVAPDAPERDASWAMTVELLKEMKERGVADLLVDKGR